MKYLVPVLLLLCSVVVHADTLVGTLSGPQFFGALATYTTTNGLVFPCVNPVNCVALTVTGDINVSALGPGVADPVAFSAPGALGGAQIAGDHGGLYYFVSIQPCPFTGVGTFSCDTSGTVLFTSAALWSGSYSFFLVGTETINVVFDPSCPGGGCYELSSGSFELTTTPEPSSLVLCALGLLSIGRFRKKV